MGPLFNLSVSAPIPDYGVPWIEEETTGRRVMWNSSSVRILYGMSPLSIACGLTRHRFSSLNSHGVSCSVWIKGSYIPHIVDRHYILDIRVDVEAILRRS